MICWYKVILRYICTGYLLIFFILIAHSADKGNQLAMTHKPIYQYLCRPWLNIPTYPACYKTMKYCKTFLKARIYNLKMFIIDLCDTGAIQIHIYYYLASYTLIWINQSLIFQLRLDWEGGDCILSWMTEYVMVFPLAHVESISRNGSVDRALDSRLKGPQFNPGSRQHCNKTNMIFVHWKKLIGNHVKIWKITLFNHLGDNMQ